MPDSRRGVLRPVLIVLLIVASALLASGLSDDPPHLQQPQASASPVTEAELRLQLGRNKLHLSITTVSVAHEAALRELLADQFSGLQIEADFREGLLLPANWESLSARLLYVVAVTRSASVSADSDSVTIHAASDNLENYEARLAFLRDALSRDYRLESELISPGTSAALEELCARNFAAITEQTGGTRQALQFRQSSVALATSADALLDKLAEFAYDCQDAQIAIVGHTDSTGAESWNVRVSEARAQAVATQLVQRGVAADRLLVEGRGSQSPLADNDTVQGRAQNRRIEFELR